VTGRWRLRKLAEAAARTGNACGIYLITPASVSALTALGRAGLRAVLETVPIAALQVRIKPSDDTEAVKQGAELCLEAARDLDTAVLINDRPDLVPGLGADGVHVGQHDTAYAEARRLVGDDRSVGVTCHDSRHLAMQAADAGADYVAFGAFFPTQTKEPPTTASISVLEDWARYAVTPCVAIGGITAENCAPLVRAGADFLAVSGFVWSHAHGPAAAVRALHAAIGQAEEA
jgi:thiamine-phosphate pyrophosphorylase